MSTTVTGNINDLTGTAVTSNCYVRFWLRGCNGNQPRVGGSALIAPDNGPTYFQDFTPNGSGQISGTLYSNDVNISAGGQVGVTWYGVQVFLNGIPGAETPYSLADGVSFNLNSATPISTNPVVAAPTGDSTYARLDGGNQPFTGAITATGANVLNAKTFEGVRFADKYAGTSFDAQVAAAIADLPATGAGTVDCRNMSNLTMTANLVINRSNTRLLFGQYTVSQGTFSITVPAPTSNIAMIGVVPIGSDPSDTIKGTYFVYTGTGSAHALGDTSTTSYNHLVEGITVDITGAGNAAVGIDSSRVYHTVLNYVRVAGKIGVNTQIGIRNNGTTNAPGSQNMLIVSPYLSNCFIGIQAIGGNSPPSCNMNQIIGGEITGSGSGTAGSIGLDIENGNNNNVYGFVISNYETGIKVASTSGRAVYGDFHSEAVTNAVNFAAGTGSNWLFTDSQGTIIDSGNNNTVIRTISTVQFGFNLQNCNLATNLDNPLNLSLQAGLSADQQINLNFKDKSAASKWIIQKQSTNGMVIQNATGNNLIFLAQDGSGQNGISAPTTGTLDFNLNNNNSGVARFLNTNGSVVGVQIDNTGTLKPGTAGAVGLGTNALPFSKLFVGAAATNNIQVVGTATAARTLTIQDQTGTIPVTTASTSQKSESAVDANVLTFTPPATAGSYRIRFILSVSVAASAVVGWTATWTDSNGTAKAPTNLSLYQVGTAAPALTFTTSTTDDFYGDATIDINNAGTNIVIKFTLGSGTITAKASATIERLI